MCFFSSLALLRVIKSTQALTLVIIWRSKSAFPFKRLWRVPAMREKTRRRAALLPISYGTADCVHLCVWPSGSCSIWKNAACQHTVRVRERSSERHLFLIRTQILSKRARGCRSNTCPPQGKKQAPRAANFSCVCRFQRQTASFTEMIHSTPSGQAERWRVKKKKKKGGSWVK